MHSFASLTPSREKKKFNFTRGKNKKKRGTLKSARKNSLDEIPEISENVSELMEHAKLATLQMLIINKKIFFLCLSVIFGLIHDVFSFFLRMVLYCIKNSILVLIFIYLYMLNLCPKRRGKNPFHNKSKVEILKKLDKIWKYKKLTIALDLDNTLIRSSRTKLASSISSKQRNKSSNIDSTTIYVRNFEDEEVRYNIYFRPFLNEFIEEASELFDIVIFTASDQQYADKIIDRFDSWKAIKRRYYRDKCDIVDGVISKDLSKIVAEGKVMSTLMVENSSPVVVQRDNLLEVSPWDGRDEEDQELVLLLDFLKKHAKVNSSVTDFSKCWKAERGHATSERKSSTSRKYEASKETQAT